jgi:zinc protease
LARYAFVKALYKDHLYQQDVTGTIESLSNITAKDCQTHYQKHFAIDGAWIGLSGYVNPTMVELTGLTLKRALPVSGEVPFSPRQAQRPPALAGKKLILVDKPGRSQTHFYMGHPTQHVTHPHYFDFSVYSTAFAGSIFQAKYMQEIRVKRGWSYGAYGSMDQRKEANSYYLYTFPKNEDTADAIALSLEMYAQAMKGEILEPNDIAFAKNYLDRSFPFKVDTPNKILSQKIHQRLLGLPDDYLQNYRQNIRAVKNENILDHIQPFFSPEKKVITVLGTASEIQKSLEEKISDFELEVVPYTDLIT